MNFWHIQQDLISVQMKKDTKKTKSESKRQAKSKTKGVAKQKKPKNKKAQMKEQQEVQKQILPSAQFGYSIQGANLKVRLHKSYEVKNQNPTAQNMKNWVTLFIEKEKRRNPNIFKVTQFSYFPTFQFQLAGQKPDHDKCAICQFEYENLTQSEIEKQLIQESQNDVVTLPCSHLMHYGCLKMLIGEKQWIKCPVCGTIYGKMIGDQPPGEMTWIVNKLMNCDGYPDCGTIIITYRMHSGKRGAISFPGTTRVAYLPDNQGGNQVLKLLKEGFDRKLIFTVGRSVTTGRDNQIVWNGVHHKTNTSGGSSHFGYPDPTYFDRVKLQLAAKGIHPPISPPAQ